MTGRNVQHSAYPLPKTRQAAARWPVERTSTPMDPALAFQGFCDYDLLSASADFQPFSRGLEYKKFHPAKSAVPIVMFAAGPAHQTPDDAQSQGNLCDAEKERVRRVRVSALLKKGSILLGFLCGISLVMWFVSGVPLVNPFAAALLIVVSPFIYWMGRTSEQEENKI